jgi:acyl carrier protein phosphodiesterase
LNIAMNWLAHLYLSEPSPEFRVGNLLPDLLPRADLKALPAEFQAGVERHYRIDAFTDAHPRFRGSIRRFSPRFRRFGGVLTDVLYDHFLARDWEVYCDQPLAQFAATVYASFDACRPHLPEAAFLVLERMRAGNWLCAYREMDGIRTALDRIGSRLRRPLLLGDAVAEFELHGDAWHRDFAEFFPELQAFVAGNPDQCG